MKRIGLYGGIFDPIHSGHLAAADLARRELSLDEVWFIVALDPPHKDGSYATMEDRLAMVELATHDYRTFIASDIETKLPRPSHTIVTVRAIQERFPDDDFMFIMGMDEALTFSGWYHADELVGLIPYWVGPRTGYTTEHLESLMVPISEANRKLLASTIGVLDHEVSSTHLREELGEGQSDHDIPEAVQAYIQKQGLYRHSKVK